MPTWLHVGVFLDVLAFCAALVATNMRLGVSWCCLGCVLGHLGVSWVRLVAFWGCLIDVSAQILKRLGVIFLIVLVPVSGYSGDGERFCEVVCVRRLEAERLDGFNFVGRAQRAMRAERWEGFAIHLHS